MSYRNFIEDGSGNPAFVRAKVRVPNKQSLKLAVDLQGNIFSYEAYKGQFAKEHFDQYGKLSIEAAQRINKGDHGGFFYVITSPEYTLPPDAQVSYKKTQDRHTSYILKHADAIEMSKDPGVFFIEPIEQPSQTSEEASDYRTTAESLVPSSSAYSQSNSTFNAAGIYGNKINVGVSENIAKGCGINENHEAFDFISSLTYAEPLASCSSTCSCGDAYHTHCDTNANICIGQHANYVASRIASSSGGVKYHASSVDLFVDNKNGTKLISDLESSFDFFLSNEVEIVNFSSGYSRPEGSRKVFFWKTSFHARHDNMTYVQAAGNQISSTGSDCPLDVVCVGSTEDVGSTSDYVVDKMAIDSAYRNPPLLDVEQPDVVTEGVKADLADTKTYSTWVSDSGTSFSAPIVSGLLALLEEQCNGLSHLERKVFLRTFSYEPQTLEGASSAHVYPVPGESPDSKAGTGIINADALSLLCGTRPPNQDDPLVATGGGEIAPDDPIWQPVPAYMNDYKLDPDVLTKQSDIVSSAIKGGPNTERAVIGSFSLLKGSRFRVSFSSLGCTQSGYPSDPVPWQEISSAIDFDLALCDDSTGKCYGLSESFDDVDEGFDIILPEDMPNGKLMILKPTSASTSCNNLPEPYSWAAVWW